MGRPVPTNDWWCNFLTSTFGGNCFNYPLNYQAKASGLVINNTVPTATADAYRQPMSDVHAVVVGTSGLAAGKASVCDYSDWTVTLNWDDKFKTTIGQGMPFTYFTKASSEVAQVTVHGYYVADVTISGNKLLVLNNMNKANYVVYAPAGSTWSGSGGVYTSTLNGQNYWSMAMLPPGTDVAALTAEYEKHAYVFPEDTKAAWSVSAEGVVRTTFTITPSVKEGASSTMLQGLLPHHWSRLASDSPTPSNYSYKTVRGQMKALQGNTWVVENRFSGILPTLPNLAKYSQGFAGVPGFDPGALSSKIDQMKNSGLDLWTDSYNEGQGMNRLIQAARIADQLGMTSARDSLIKTVKDRLENWFTASAGEVAFLMYYDTKWTTLIGYPAGHHMDDNINDHHYHWGYFLNAAAAVEQFHPGWSAQWGPMVNMLVRDAASPDRNDPLFPYLRNFNVFSGHGWGNGTCNQPFGVDEESTPEAMNFNSGLIQWAAATGNTELRNLGIYLYTTEQSAVEEYWYDVHQRTFQPEYKFPMVARLWAGGYDNGTWWSPSASACYGIQLYPIHGGTLYMGNHVSYVQRVWNGLVRDTPVMSNYTYSQDPNCWYDVLWCYQAFLDPDAALTGYHRWQGRDVKVGASDAQTYHWLHTMRSLGRIRPDIAANHPIAAVFEKNAEKTYVAHNYGSAAMTVRFSDGATLDVPARSMATNRDISATVSLSAGAVKVDTGGTVDLTAAVTGSGIDKVEFYQDGSLIGTKTGAPYTHTTAGLTAGLPRFYAKVFVGAHCNLSNIVTVQVGGQVPFGGTAPSLPGTIQAGEFDVFEGGSGQGITYFDVTPWNEGGFRPTEAVDAGTDANEGHTVGWIDAGEWLTYTVNVAKTGSYDVTVKTASGLAGGGGPFWFEVNGIKISPDITVPFTDKNWSSYQPKVVTGVNLAAGTQVLRLRIGSGGFNLGRITFDLSAPPTAPSINTQPESLTVKAGQTATFSVMAEGSNPLTYQWRKDGIAINGAVTSSYTTPVTAASDNGAAFSVVVSNSLGSVTSNSATLSVNSTPEAPSITAQPISVSVTEGSSASFTAAVAGFPVPSVQWQRNVDGTWTDLSGATSLTYATPASTLADNGAQFRVVASNASGSVTSNPAALTVKVSTTLVIDDFNSSERWNGKLNNLGKSITTNGGNYNLEGNANLFFFYNGGSVAESFTERIDQSLAAYGDLVITLSGGVGGEESTVFLVLNDGTDHSLGLAKYGTLTTAYKKITIPLVDFGANLASTAFLRVEGMGATTIIRINEISVEAASAEAPAITSHPASITVNSGQIAAFAVAATGTEPLSYRWRKNGNVIVGATSATYGTPAATTDDNGATFSVIVSNSAGSVTSNNATLTVKNTVVAPTITGQPVSTSVNVGQRATFSVVASGSTPLVYRWRKNGTVINGATSASYTTPPATRADNGDLFSVAVSNSAGSLISNTAILKVTSCVVSGQLETGEKLVAGQQLRSKKGKYCLIMQGDGNLVLYDRHERSLWATGTQGTGATWVVLQGDGNLVLYTSEGKAVWASRTAGTGANLLRLSDKGDLTLYKGKREVKSLFEK